MKRVHISQIRRKYSTTGLVEKDAPRNPLVLFDRWFKEALQANILDVNAMTLATVSPQGKPKVRAILLKGFDSRGFVFYTNYESDKARDLVKHSQVSMLFFWPLLKRQVRVDGRAQKVPAKESDQYFKIRPRDSQIGVWASRQSRVIPGREILEKSMRLLERKFRNKPVPRPPHWGGYRVIPETFEFWKGRPHRLHDRIRYNLLKGKWKIDRLSP